MWAVRRTIVREPGRSDAGGDARPDRTDVLTAAEAGDVGVPADGGPALPHASDQIPDVAPESGWPGRMLTE